MSVIHVISVANFWANSAGCFGQFHVALKHIEDLKNLILEEKYNSVMVRGLLLA